MTLAADPRKFVFIDESATNLNMQRDYAYSPRGMPAYSPDLSPIELFFSKLKSILKACAARCLETLSAAVKQAIDATTLSDIMGWFRESGYPAH
jgi:hypothetical protein